MHLLSAILTKATGMTALDFAWEYLFGPLGMREVIWPADAQGFNHGWGDLRLYPQDAAKIGQLWLNGGTRSGRRLVSEDWVKAAVTSYKATTDEGMDYGYGRWIKHESEVGGEIRAQGRGGQYIVIYPALKALAVMTGDGGYGSGDVTDLVAPALVDPTKALPANPDGVARLAEVAAGLVAPPAAQRVPPLPTTATAVSGRTYGFAENPLDLKTLRLTFDDSAEAMLDYTDVNGNTVSAAVGLDGVYRMTAGDYGFPLGVRGAWADDQTFVIDYDAIANNDAYQLRLRFTGDTVTVEAHERTFQAGVQFEGKAATG